MLQVQRQLVLQSLGVFGRRMSFLVHSGGLAHLVSDAPEPEFSPPTDPLGMAR